MLSRLANLCALTFALTALSSARAEEFKANHLFVSCTGSDAIVEFDENGVFVRVIAPPGLVDPESIAFGPNGHLYAASRGTHEIFDILPSGLVFKKYFIENLAQPKSISFGPGGLLYISGIGTKKIYMLDVLSGTGQSFGEIPITETLGYDDIRFTSSGSLIALVRGQSLILETTLIGKNLRVKPISLGIQLPAGVAIGPYEQVWYTSNDNNSLVRSTAYLAPLDNHANTEFAGANKLTMGPNGHMFVACAGFNDVAEFDPKSFQFVRAIATSAPSMNGVAGIAFAPSRFEAEIDVDFCDDEIGIDDIEEDVFLTVAPGSHTIMVQFKEGKDGDGLGAKFFQDGLIFHGTEPMDEKSKRRIDGNEYYRNAGEGTARIDLEIKGSTKGGLGHLLVKKAYGRISRSGAGGLYTGEIKTKKLLNG